MQSELHQLLNRVHKHLDQYIIILVKIYYVRIRCYSMIKQPTFMMLNCYCNLYISTQVEENRKLWPNIILCRWT